jgi:hypothetical protein
MSRIAVIVAPLDVTRGSNVGLEEATEWANELASERVRHVLLEDQF